MPSEETTVVEQGMFPANHGFGAGFCGLRVFEKNVGMVTDRRAFGQNHPLPAIVQTRVYTSFGGHSIDDR